MTFGDPLAWRSATTPDATALVATADDGPAPPLRAPAA